MHRKENPYKNGIDRRGFLRACCYTAAGISLSSCSLLSQLFSEKDVTPELPKDEFDNIDISSIPVGADVYVEGYLDEEKVSEKYLGKTNGKFNLPPFIYYLYYHENTDKQRQLSLKGYPDYYLIKISYEGRKGVEIRHLPNKKSDNWESFIYLERIQPDFQSP
jgi:hypothetical protein